MLYLLMGNCALNGPTSGQHELSANVEKPFKENAEGLQNMPIKGKPCLGMLGIDLKVLGRVTDKLFHHTLQIKLL